MIPASVSESPRTIEEYHEAVKRVRQESAKRRTLAWANLPETVLGMELNAITPAILSILVSTENAFLLGERAGEHDLRNFVWFCSPLFNPDAPTFSLSKKPLQMFRLNCALKRRSKWKQPKGQAVISNFVAACMDINQILSATFADGLPSGGDGTPLAASLEAQLIDSFAREYLAWPLPKPVRHTPIKQLFQLARCIDRVRCGEQARYFDPAESAVDKAFFAAINPQLGRN